MQTTYLNNEDNAEQDNNNKIENVIDDLTYETPVGWSSICLDQTIHYYIDCNINIANNRSIEI